MKEKAKNILNRILNILSLFLLLFAVGMLSYVTVCKFSGKTPQIFGYSFHFVVSDSMEPDIMTGDFVIGKKISVAKLYEDNKNKEDKDKDVILFVSPNPADADKVIVHKIRTIVENDDGYSIYTYGVNNPIDDIYPTTAVIGKVVAVSGFFGKVFNPLGIVFVLLIFGIILIFYYAAKYFIRNYREPKADPSSEPKDKTSLETKDETSSEPKDN